MMTHVEDTVFRDVALCGIELESSEDDRLMSQEDARQHLAAGVLRSQLDCSFCYDIFMESAETCRNTHQRNPSP